MSRLDYSNGLLYVLPKSTVYGLQSGKNSAARIVTQERPRDHDSISRALMELHWLPVDKRIEYKMLLHTLLSLWRSVGTFSMLPYFWSLHTDTMDMDY